MIEEHVVNDLGMQRVPDDSDLFIKIRDFDTEGIMGTYVDDFLNAGTPKFERETQKTMEFFGTKPPVYDNFDFFGTQIYNLSNRIFILNRSYYASNLNKISLEALFEDFYHHRASFSWLTH